MEHHGEYQRIHYRSTREKGEQEKGIKNIKKNYSQKLQI